MKKTFPLFVFSLFISQAFSIAGFGAYGNLDLLKYPSGISGDKTTSGVEYVGFDNPNGFGLMLYIDVIPVIDLEIDMEVIGNMYKYIPYIGGQALPEGELPWGRAGFYFTARKEILGLSIPLLAKTQLYGGLGFNKQVVSPIMTLDLIQAAFPSTANLDAALTESTSSDDQIEALATYMVDNSDVISGFHLQAGMQGKL